MKNKEQLKRTQKNDDLVNELKGIKAQTNLEKTKLGIQEEKERILKIAT
jgi:hypothetical protein